MKLTIRLHDSDPRSEAIKQWLSVQMRGRRNDAMVAALYVAATGQQQAAAQPAQVDLAAIRRVVEAAVRTALNGVNIQAPSAEQEDIVRETVDDVLADLDPAMWIE